ncbi:MAG TPA: hypothetical protein VGE50_00590 [Gammaproteobacteria bacterium]
MAIQLIEQRQPDQREEPQRWMQWERSLIGLLRDNGAWLQLEQHVNHNIASLPPDQQRWLATQRVEALLNLQRPQEARFQLRELMWNETGATATDVARWRHLVIQSYLEEGRINDAYDAMLRHRQDYGDGDREAMMLRARVLLANERPSDARLQLKNAGEGADAASLRLLAALRLGEPVKEIIQEARRRLKENPASNRARLILWGVVAEGSARLGDQAARAIALEQFYGEANPTQVEAGLLHFTPDSLWESYITYGLEIGNQEQLLLGDDTAWLKSAEAAGSKYPLRSRSLYAVVAERALSNEARLKGHRALVQQLAGKEHKSTLVKTLYLDSQRFTPPKQLPVPVRYFLYDTALAEADLELAARMRQGLVDAPADVDPFQWQLRGARVFMLAGDYEHAAGALSALLNSAALNNQEQLDRVMQVVFDMQTVGEHDRAVKLFEQMAVKPLEPQTRREILYWIGDSRLAQQRYLEAARYYLHSAILPGIQTMDPWAQTARYQTAKALTQAGLKEDAAVLYRQLLLVTDDPARKAVLQRELEQLHLALRK